MRNLVFVIWMIGFPVVTILGSYMSHLSGEKFSEEATRLAAMIEMFLWFVIGAALYEKAPPTQIQPKDP